MTLVELVVAFVVLMVILVPIAILLTNTVGQSATARERLTALSLAEQCLEKLNNTGPTLSQGVPETGVAILENSHCIGSSTVVESTITYTIHAEFTWETAQGSHPDLCTSSVAPTLIDAQVWTTWGKTQKVSDTTLLDYPPPGLPTDGFLAVVVNGTPAGSPPADAKGRAWSTRVQLVPVTIKRTGFSVTLYPNSYGCVFEEVPAPDSYTVSAANPTVGGSPASPAWMSATETTTTSATATANLGAVTKVTLRYDEGSLVSLQYPSTTATEGSVTCPAAGQVECVVFGQSPTSATTPAKTPKAELSVLNTTTKKWTVSSLSGAARLSSLACAATKQCIAVGFGGGAGAYTGASYSSGTSATPSFSADTVPSGVTALSGIACPTATRCYAWGVGSSGGVILTGTVTTTSVTWGASPDTLATVPARVTSLACWAKTRCYAIGTKKTTTKPVALSLSTTTSRKWTNDTLPTTTTYAPLTLTQLTCPGSTKCYAIGSRKTTHAEVLSLSTTTSKKWTKDTVPSTVTTLSKVTCPSKTVCYAIGTRKTGSTYGAITSLTTATTWKVDTPKTTKSVTAITCPTTTACLAMGTSSTGAQSLLWRTAASTFTAETVPSSVTTLTAITCASASHCFAVGAASSAGSSYGVVLSGTSTWALDTLPSTPTTVSLFGLACGGTQCAAPGASETAALYLDGTPSGTGWTNATPSGAQGMYIGGVPIAVTNSGLPTHPIEVAVPAGTAAATQIGPLFPFSSGYTAAATECKPLPASVSVASTPGATSSGTMPMGLLTIRVVNKYGNPDTGATVSASIVTGSTCTELSPPSGKTNPASFNLEPTGPLGYSQVDVPYGTYKITVTHSTHSGTITKVTVSPTSVSVTTGTAQAVWSPLVVTVT
jgi:Tfp pilus assembly protein PilV